jgi:hypothetical protein
MTQQYPPQQPPGGGYGPPPQRPPQQPQYGQQPPQQQQYGQQPPPQQPQYGQPAGGPPPQTPPGGMPGTPSYPPTPKKSKGRLYTILAIALVVIGVVVYFGIKQSKVAPSSASAGDCIKVNSASASDADVEKIDCTSPEAVYKVGKKLDSTAADCPSDSYDKYTQSGGSGDDFALCLMLNAKQGDCFASVTSGDATTRVPCTDPKAEGKVSKVVQGKAADSACPENTGLALDYPEPAPGETVCMDQVSGGSGT